MTELLTAAQMRAIEQAAIDSGEVTGLELMERAGQGVVEAIFEEWPEFGEPRGPAPAPPGYLDHREEGWRAVVLCGPGNNGGDGFVVARLLRALGWEVEVFLYGDAEKLPVDARVNYERWVELGEVRDYREAIADYSIASDLIIDAIFGTGLSRPLSPELSEFYNYCAYHPTSKIVAIDAISGVDLDSGRELVTSDAVFDASSDLTVTFHKEKIGHRLGDFVVNSQKLKVVSIGIEKFDHGDDTGPELNDLSEDCWGGKGPLYTSHKFSHGHALTLSGPSGKGGAARLAARGALRIGAGLVSVGVPHSALAENAAQLDAVMLAEIEDGDALSRVLEDERINALCLGPGLGVERARELVPVALRSGRACVLDADALSIFENKDDDLFSQLHTGCVLTPHAGEFRRVFPDIAAKLVAVATKGPAYSKVDATREAAVRAGCVVLFKGADTVIASPDGRCAINSAHYERAAPWLATAGSGDVLAGFIAGLLARGFAPMQAAETASWLHVECARSFGPGLIAEDLPEELPKVFRELNL